MAQEEKLRATNHYLYYPDEDNIPPYLAYGFRVVFLLLAPYIILSMLLWSLVWSGVITFAFMDDILSWHIYEMLFGILTAGIMAFLTTGLPELFPGMVPFVGKRLWNIMALWVLGRISFWTIDITGIYLAAFFNLFMLGWLIWFAKDTVLDKLQRHASLGYIMVIIFGVECWFFASKLSLTTATPLSILKVATGAVVILILLALRRVNMEAINELMEDKHIDDVFISRPPKTNLAIFAITVFTLVEFLYPTNSALGWLGLAAGAAVLGITADYALKNSFILHLPNVLYLASIYVLLALGYAFMGWGILSENLDSINHFRHFITSGAIGLSYMVVMIIISQVHTGRHLTTNIYTHLMVLLIIIATVMRISIPFFPHYTSTLYITSAIVWTIPFMLYIKLFFGYLLAPRADGIKG